MLAYFIKQTHPFCVSPRPHSTSSQHSVTKPAEAGCIAMRKPTRISFSACLLGNNLQELRFIPLSSPLNITSLNKEFLFNFIGKCVAGLCLEILQI